MRRLVRDDSRGFTLAEVLLASLVLMIAILVVAAMFPTGYRAVTDAGRMTQGVTAARQILEDIGSLPFTSVPNLNNYDTANSGTVPAADPERAAARRWRYMLAGAGGGFTFTGTEQTNWGNPTTFGGRAVITVANGPSGTTRIVTVTVSIPGLSPTVQVSTVVVGLF